MASPKSEKHVELTVVLAPVMWYAISMKVKVFGFHLLVTFLPEPKRSGP